MAAFGQAISQAPTTQEFENIFTSIQALIATLQSDVQNVSNVVKEHHQTIEQIKSNARNDASSSDQFGANSDVYKRIQNTHFFQKIPPKEFESKMEWDKWSESLKDDLAGEMPEGLTIIKHVEDNLQALIDETDTAGKLAEFTQMSEVSKLVNAKLTKIKSMFFNLLFFTFPVCNSPIIYSFNFLYLNIWITNIVMIKQWYSIIINQLSVFQYVRIPLIR